MTVQVPVTLANLVEGPARWLWAPYTVARPVKLDDIIALTSPYAPKAGWVEGGATTDSISSDRDMDSTQKEIEQRTSAVVDRITSVERTMTVPMAEITPEGMQIVEVSPAITTIAVGAAASGTPAQKRVGFGSIGSLPRYRIALIGERPKEYAPGAADTRGQLVAQVYYSAAVAAEGSELEIGRDDFVGREITFKAFPDPAVATFGEEEGCFLFETGLVVP